MPVRTGARDGAKRREDSKSAAECLALPRNASDVILRPPRTCLTSPGGLMTRLGTFITAFIACAALAKPASAQSSTTPTVSKPPSFTSPAGKGIIGGALLGAESVMLVEAAAEVKPAWAYAVGGGLGAIGGGIGGYFTQQIGTGQG